MAYRDKQKKAEYQRQYTLKNKVRIALWRKENKESNALYQKKYRQDHKEANSIYQKRYQQENRVKTKIYLHKNREAIAKYMKRYRQEKKEEGIIYRKNYRQEHKEATNEWERNRRKENLQYKLTKSIRSRLRSALKNNQKIGSAVRDLGCTIPELKMYLEGQFVDGMTWENWSFRGWHIDHKIPLAFFDLTDKKQFLEAVNYINLQPMWARENLIKSKKYNEQLN